jgi:hypothetical protein
MVLVYIKTVVNYIQNKNAIEQDLLIVDIN